MAERRDVRRRWRFRALERLVAWALYRMVVLAAADGDRHEVNHIDAQFAVAETSRCGPDCLLRHMPVRDVRITPTSDPLDLTTRITAALQRAGVEPLVGNPGRPLDELVVELTDRQRELERERIRERLEALPAWEPVDLEVILAGELCGIHIGEGDEPCGLSIDHDGPCALTPAGGESR